MKKKAILIVLDGAADRPVPSLGGKTPFERANLPSFDRMAKEGICGIMDVIGPGIPPGSDTAQMAFLSHDPYEYYTGRGALEALGGGINVRLGDVCFRANLASVEKNEENKLIVTDRRAGRIISEAKEIVKVISEFKPPFDDVELELVHTTQHRCALLLRGNEITHEIVDTDPHDVNLPLHELVAAPGNIASERTVKIIKAYQDFIYQSLDNHPINIERRKAGKPPVNMVLFRGAALRPNLMPFDEKFGINGGFICGNALIAGVCLSAGLKPALTDGDIDFERKMAAAFHALEDNDFLFFHIKETDNLSHDHKPEKIVELLEEIDEKVIKEFLLLDPASHVMAVTADHTTSSVTGEHVGDPVPVAIWGTGVRTDPVAKFDEYSCARGGLCRIKGKELIYILMDLIDRVKKFGS
ncbi:MAG: 2,3-bisphosphoglycerate-independent phosphoglycerate mutase [Candidatus Hodarchaeota archaeon]